MIGKGKLWNVGKVVNGKACVAVLNVETGKLLRAGALTWTPLEEVVRSIEQDKAEPVL